MHDRHLRFVHPTLGATAVDTALHIGGGVTIYSKADNAPKKDRMVRFVSLLEPSRATQQEVIITRESAGSRQLVWDETDWVERTN